VLYKDLVIVNANIESGALVALDKNTGKEMWRAASLSDSWSTPLLVEIPKGGTELVVSEAKKVLGFDPDTGKELWHVNYNQHPWYGCASAVAHEGVVYAFAHNSVAIRAGGRGDITTTHTLWQKGHHCLTSPVYHEDYLYFPDGPVAFCVKADDGKEMYRERLVAKPNPDDKSDIDRPGDCYASPLVADGKIYCVSRGKGNFVLEAGPKFKQLAHNTLDADAGVCNGNPAVSSGQLLLRSDRYLYCIGKKAKP